MCALQPPGRTPRRASASHGRTHGPCGVRVNKDERGREDGERSDGNCARARHGPKRNSRGRGAEGRHERADEGESNNGTRSVRLRGEVRLAMGSPSTSWLPRTPWPADKRYVNKDVEEKMGKGIYLYRLRWPCNVDRHAEDDQELGTVYRTHISRDKREGEVHQCAMDECLALEVLESGRLGRKAGWAGSGR